MLRIILPLILLTGCSHIPVEKLARLRSAVERLEAVHELLCHEPGHPVCEDLGLGLDEAEALLDDEDAGS